MSKSSYNRVDIRALDNAIGILDHLKRCGGDLSDDVFLPKHFMKSPAILHDVAKAKAQLDVFLMVLESLKSFRDILNLILNFAMTTISSLQEHCRSQANYVGIHTLPDELLSRIFETGYSSQAVVTKGDAFSVKVSHVDKRFRAIALDTPRIWRALSNAHQPDQLHTFIQRSKAAKLCISMNEYCVISRSRSQSTVDFWAAVLPHAVRWSEFRYFRLIESITEDKEVLCRYTGLELPSLTSLTLNPEEEDPEISALTAQWSMPSLRHFRTADNLEPRNYKPSWFHTLTSYDFTVSASEDSMQELSDHTPLLITLQSIPRLESLCFRCSEFNYGVKSSHLIITLPNLKYMNITLSYEAAEYPEWLIFLFNTFLTPNLSTLSIDIHFSPAHVDLSEWRKGLVLSPNSPRAPLSPARLELRTSISENSSLADTVLSLMMSRLSLDRLEYLSLEAPSLLLGIQVRDQIPGHLRSLRLHQCDKVKIDKVLDVVTRLIGGGECEGDDEGGEGRWERFDRLEITDCRSIKAKDAMHLQQLLGDKLAFSE